MTDEERQHIFRQATREHLLGHRFEKVARCAFVSWLGQVHPAMSASVSVIAVPAGPLPRGMEYEGITFRVEQSTDGSFRFTREAPELH